MNSVWHKNVSINFYMSLNWQCIILCFLYAKHIMVLTTLSIRRFPSCIMVLTTLSIWRFPSCIFCVIYHIHFELYNVVLLVTEFVFPTQSKVLNFLRRKLNSRLKHYFSSLFFIICLSIRRQQPTNCLSVFDHLVGLALKG